MHNIPRRLTPEAQRSLSKPKKKGKGGTMQEERAKKLQQKAEVKKNRWREEGWMVVPQSEYYLRPQFGDKKATTTLPRRSSRLYCFSQLWSEEIVSPILRRSEISLGKYWVSLAIRIYFHGQQPKGDVRDQWPLPTEVFLEETLCYQVSFPPFLLSLPLLFTILSRHGQTF